MTSPAIGHRPLTQAALQFAPRSGGLLILALCAFGGAFYIPNPTIGLSLFSVGLTLLFVTAVVRQKASQYQSLQAGLHASVTDYFEYDSTPAVTTDGSGQIQYRNQAAISRFRDGGETLLSALDQTISAPAATLRRLKDRAERSGFAREEVVARSGHIRLSAHRIGHDNILWRIEEIAERGQASRSAASLALPMMTISKAGTVLFMNETLKRLLGGRAAHLDRVVNDLPIRADQVHEVAGAGGPIKARIHVIQGGIGRQEIYTSIPHVAVSGHGRDHHFRQPDHGTEFRFAGAGNRTGDAARL